MYLCRRNLHSHIIMISIIGRKFGKENLVRLSVRMVTKESDNAIALGISIDKLRWQLIEQTLKAAKASYKRGTSIFIDDILTSKLWQLYKELSIEEKAGSLDADSATKIINAVLHQEEIKIIEKKKAEKEKMEQALRELNKPTLSQFIDQYINECESGARLKRRSTKKISPATIKGYKTFRNVFADYQKKNKKIVDWEDVTLDLYFDLKNFYIEQAYSPNTIARYMRTFKIMLNAAKELHLTANDDFQSSRFSVDWEEVDNIYLSTERIKEMYDIDLMDYPTLQERIRHINDVDESKLDELREFIQKESHRRMLDNARDVFVAGCLLGQRVSDYSRVDDNMIEELMGKEFIHLTQQKTGKEVYIPMLGFLKDIMVKHHGSLPHIKDSKLNARIKLVGLLLGWTEPANINEQKGHLSFTSKKKFYECIVTHTARRSFATNAYKSGVPLSAIMAVTGHSTEQMLRKYLKLDSKERALLAAAEFDKVAL